MQLLAVISIIIFFLCLRGVVFHYLKKASTAGTEDPKKGNKH